MNSTGRYVLLHKKHLFGALLPSGCWKMDFSPFSLHLKTQIRGQKIIHVRNTLEIVYFIL